MFLHKRKYITGKKIGEGTYGIVYRAKREKEEFAVKRNINTNSEEIGICSLREADALYRVKGSPFVIDTEEVISNSNIGFSFERSMKENEAFNDKIHFIFPLMDKSLRSLIKEGIKSEELLSNYTLQILLGLNWIHSKGIIHRDLNPMNILFHAESNNLKIIDFGMCAQKYGKGPSTPNLVTCWYRAPELCTSDDTEESKRIIYNQKIDMWSLGAIMFEMIADRPFQKGCKDNYKILLKKYFELLPEQNNSNLTSQKVFDKTVSRLKNMISEKKLRRFSTEFKDLYFEIMASLLTRDIKFRPTSEEVLLKYKDTFFVGMKDLLTKYFIPSPSNEKNENENEAAASADVPPVTYHLELIKSFSSLPPLLLNNEFKINRIIGYELFCSIYNNRKRIPWYSHRILFHSLELYDIYLYYASRNDCSLFRLKNSDNDSDFSNNIYRKAYTCLYMFYKFFTTLEETIFWEDFFPDQNFSNDKTKNFVEKFEFFLFEEVCKYVIYRKTYFEHLVEKEKNDINSPLFSEKLENEIQTHLESVKSILD